MPVLVRKPKIQYFPIPKAACTSLKHTMWEIENGRPFEGFRVGDDFVNIHSVHKGYGTVAWREDFRDRGPLLYNFSLVRDPVKRVLSCYTNRIMEKNDLKRIDLRVPLPDHVPAEPSVEDFFEYLPEYQKASKSIDHHTRPALYFLGPDLSFYDRIFGIHELDELADILSDRVGKPVHIPHKQTGGPKISLNSVSQELQDKVAALYREDYEALSHVFV